MRPRVVRLDTLIANLRKLVRGAIGEHIELAVDVAPGLWRVNVDPSMLGQVVLNLAVNARDAMPDGGTLTVRARNEELGAAEAEALSVSPGRYAVIEVSDTGTGMPEHVAARVFEPFFTTKPTGKGTGLGLATAHDIVQQAGGTIALRTQQGEGSTFRVLLPATDEKEGHFAVPAMRAGGGRETVLVAEDERLVRELTTRILTDAGYTVLDAKSGPDALEVAARHPGRIDLLLSDIVMPGMTGRQLAKQLGDGRPDLRVLYMSAYFDEGPGGEAQRDTLPKPFQRDVLLQRVRSALAR
jgi:CheY-like chemotaxis protein